MEMHSPLRPFGSAADLDVDFTTGDRPVLVTEVLAGRGGDAGFWWSQPVGTRTAALLRLVETREVATLAFTADCGCGVQFEFELPLGSLIGLAGDTAMTAIELDGRALTLRRPTGGDLRDWRAAPSIPHAAMVRRMIDTLLVEGDADDGDEATLAAALAALDPLVEFVAECRCPACDAPKAVAVDLETAALARLERSQRALFSEVHRIASHYGWTEAETLNVAPARRAHYLALIEDVR